MGDSTPFPQALVPYTVISPDDAVELKFTVILLVLLPAVIDAPVGSVHKYPVALFIAGIE